MWLSNSLRKIDIFGTKFGFKLEKQETYKTALGGTLTIITSTIVVLFAIFFGQDFYNRINPSVYTDLIVPQKYDPPVTLAPENFTIAWRLENYIKLSANFTRIIYPEMHNIRFKRNETTNEMEQLEYKILEMTKCNYSAKNDDEFSKNYKLDEWYCFDWSNRDFSFGGNWDGDYINYFMVGLYLCEAGQAYNETNPNCTSIDEYDKFISENGVLSMSILYPQYYFAADDVSNPLRVSYRNFYYYLPVKQEGSFPEKIFGVQRN